MATAKELEAKLKAHSRNWMIAVCVGTVILIVLMIVLFQRQERIRTDYQQKVAGMDSTLKAQQGKVDALQFVQSQQDSALKNLDQAYKNNRPKETKIIHEYETIPNTVNSLDREQLRGEVSKF